MGRRLLDSAHYLVCKHSRAARQRCPPRFRPGTTYAKGSCTESTTDDFDTCRGVVLSRAATILRSIETQPSTGRFVRFDEQPSLILHRPRLRLTQLGAQTCIGLGTSQGTGLGYEDTHMSCVCPTTSDLCLF